MNVLCIHCKHMLAGPDRGVQIIGEKPAEAYVRFIEHLISHVQRRHPDEAAKAARLGGEMMALTALANYHSTDPDFVAQREQIRAVLHQATSLPVPDAVLEQLAAQSGIPAKHRAAAIALLQELRRLMLSPATVSVVQQPAGGESTQQPADATLKL